MTKEALHVQGLHLDTISSIKDPLQFTSRSSLTLDEHRILISILQMTSKTCEMARSYPTGEPFAAALSMVLTAGLRSAAYRDLSAEQHFADFTAFAASVFGGQHGFNDSNPSESTQNSHGDPLRYHNALVRVSQGRRFYSTSKNYIGTGPEAAQTGDQIWILYGGKVPFLLRPVAGEINRYQLLGESYVHGVMFGEAMEELKSKPNTKISQICLV